MKIPRLIAIAALIWCGQSIQAMDKETEINALPGYEIVNRLPESLFADLPNPSISSAEDIIKNKDKIKQRYLTLKEKLENYGSTLPYRADKVTFAEERLAPAIRLLDRYYGQFIKKIEKNGVDASFLEQARRLNISDANLARRLEEEYGITTQWQLVETIKSINPRSDLLTLPLHGILQNYMNTAPSRAKDIQRALNKLKSSL